MASEVAFKAVSASMNIIADALHPAQPYMSMGVSPGIGCSSQCAPSCFSVLYVGGYSNTNSSNAPNYGLSYANANNDLGNANTNIGGRLTVSSLNKVTVTATSPSIDGGRFETYQAGSVPFKGRSGSRKEGNVMPNRIGNLKYVITDPENLAMAAKECCRTRKNKEEVVRFLAKKDERLAEIRLSLLDDTYHRSEYYFFKRNEHGKIRHIADLPLDPDRIVHQAFARVLEPLVDVKLIDQTHSSRPRRGIHSAIRQMQGYLDRYPKLNYCLTFDVDQCYASLDHVKLEIALERMIKDGWVMKYLRRFIGDYSPGISIGGRLSPMFCNVYFSHIDHYAKEVLKLHAYVAYADNRFVFGNSVVWLEKMRKILFSLFEEAGVSINDDWKIVDLRTEGVDALGYHLYKDHILLRKSTKKRMVRAMNTIRRKLESGLSPDAHDRGVVASYWGVLKWCDSYNLYRKYMWPVKVLIEDNDRWILGARSFRAFMMMNREVYS